MHNRSRRLDALLALTIVLAVLPLSAHTIPLETTAYFKVEGPALRVLVRLPMITLSDAKLPVTARGTLDLASGGPALAAAAAEFARSADIMDGGRPLPTPRILWVASGPNDLSFESFATAAAHLAQETSPDLAPNEGFLDFQLDYSLTATPPLLSVRFNGQRANGEFVPTRAVYLTARGDERRFAIAGPPHRVAFEPSAIDAVAMSLKLGAERLVSERLLLLMLVCLVIPLRPSSTTWQLAGAMLAAYGAVGVAVAVLPSPPSVQGQLLGQLAASIALAAAALQSMQTPRINSVRIVALIFGAASGVGVGLAGRELRPFAGSWDLAGLALFLGTIAVAALLLTTVLRIAIGVVAAALHRLPVPARAVPILLSLVPLHAALHGLQDDGQRLTAASTSHSLLSAAIANWPPLVLLLTLVLLIVLTRGWVGEQRVPSGHRSDKR